MKNNISEFPIPAGDVAVKISIIDTGSRIGKLPAAFLMLPALEKFEFMPTIPSWSFLIEHPSGHNAIFDLGMPKNRLDLAPVVADDDRFLDWDIQTPKEVIDVLEENHFPASRIKSAIWRFVSNRDGLIFHILTYTFSTVIGTGIILGIRHGFLQARTWWSVRAFVERFILAIPVNRMRQSGKAISG